jgi:hypothetical protein
MKTISGLSRIAACVAVAAGSFCAQAQAEDNPIRHVLLISVDGLHALDAARYVQSHPTSALAELSGHGVTYTDARTPANSDSFPGLLALVTGGSPVTGDVFYDVSYDRSYFVNGDTTCAGAVNDPAPGAIQTAGKGSTIAFDESVDAYVTDPVTGLAVSLNKLDPKALPYQIDANGHCVPVFPHNALKTNTIFEVVKAHGGVTAWADKHPAYDLVNGPSGKGVDDLYTPELTNVGGIDNTVSVVCTAQNDSLKVAGVVKQIHGLNHDGSATIGVPTVFGMNFQAVSVGQKLADDNFVGAPNLSCPADTGNLNLHMQPTMFAKSAGGYLDGAGTPTEVLAYGLDQTDAALQSMIDALKSQGLYDSTLFIVTAKHGQSPINPAKVNKPGHFGDLVAALTPANASEAAAQATMNIASNCGNGPCGLVQDDDIALIWLQDQSQTANVAALLNNHAKELFIDEVMAGDEIKLKFNDPLHDNRTPDIIVQPLYGTVYTGSSKKNAEHGGFSFGDTNVGLIVANPALRARTIKTPVLTSQVAPTILEALGLNPLELQSVRKEHTPALPGFEGSH